MNNFLMPLRNLKVLAARQKLLLMLTALTKFLTPQMKLSGFAPWGLQSIRSSELVLLVRSKHHCTKPP